MRVKVYASDQLNLIAAIYNGDPTGAGFTGKPWQFDPSGTDFLVRYPPFVIGEAQYAYNQDKDSTGLAGKIKFGGWYHFGNFDDEHFGFDGMSLADPDSDGKALTHSGNYSLYGVIDQMLWRLPGDDPKKGIGAFARVSAAPTDRNLIHFYADGGINFMGLWSQRPDDQFGVSASYTEVSPSAHALDVDTAFFAGERLPARDYELLLEATYQAQIMPGWTDPARFRICFPSRRRRGQSAEPGQRADSRRGGVRHPQHHPVLRSNRTSPDALARAGRDCCFRRGGGHADPPTRSSTSSSFFAL